MKKKLMAIFTIIAAVAMLIPGGVVKAAAPYKTYQKGATGNFKLHSNDSTGKLVLITEGNDNTDSKYVKAFVFGYVGAVFSDVNGTDTYIWCEGPTCEGGYTNADPFTKVKTELTTEFQGADKVYLKDADTTGWNISMLTKDEAADLFGADADGKIPADNAAMQALVGNVPAFDGIYTQTVEDGKVWAITWKDNNFKLEKVDFLSTLRLGVAPILEVDKDEDCTSTGTGEDPETPVQTPAHCYVCEEEYKWYNEADVPTGCELVADVEAESACTAQPETGVTDYVLPITIAVCAAAIALTVITKQDLFKKI